MRLHVPKLTHTFLRMVVFLVLAFLVFSPVAPAFAAITGDTNGNGVIDSWETPAETPAETPVPPDGIELFVYETAIGIGGWFAWLGGTALEYTFTRYVIKLGCYFTIDTTNCTITGADGAVGGGGTIGGIVNELWKVVRDFFNILFIFALVWIGFRMILYTDSAGAQKSLVSLIYAALLVNFSLYIAKLILDIANFTATQIYSAFQVTGIFSVTVNSGSDSIVYNFSDSGIAGAFMQTLQVTTLFSAAANDSAIIFSIVSMFFLMFLGAVFLYGAIMILVRFIAIILLLIVSPVMFLGMVVPSWKSYSTDWRKKFVAYCFFAPAFVFMIYLSLFILIQLQVGFTGGSYIGAFNNQGSPESGEIFIFFFIGAALLFMSTKVAGAAAKAGAGAALSTADGWAKKFTTGAAIAAGSYSAGYVPRLGVNKLGSLSESGVDNLQTQKGLVGWAARTRSFDAISRSGAAKLKGAQLGTGSTNEKEAKRNKEIQDKSKKTQADYAAKDKQAAAITTLSDTTKTAADYERAIADLSGSAVVAMAKDKEGEKMLLKHAKYLRPEQIKALEDDKELDKGSVKSIVSARNNAVKAKYTGTSATKAISEAPVHELSTFSVAELSASEVAVGLSEDKIDKLPEPKFIESDKTALKAARKAALVSVAQGATITTPQGTAITKDVLLKAKTADIAKYPFEALLAMADELPIPTLTKIVQDGNISKTQQKDIRYIIENFIAGSPAHADAIAYEDWLTGPLGKQLGK